MLQGIGIAAVIQSFDLLLALGLLTAPALVQQLPQLLQLKGHFGDFFQFSDEFLNFRKIF